MGRWGDAFGQPNLKIHFQCPTAFQYPEYEVISNPLASELLVAQIRRLKMPSPYARLVGKRHLESPLYYSGATGTDITDIDEPAPTDND